MGGVWQAIPVLLLLHVDFRRGRNATLHGLLHEDISTRQVKDKTDKSPQRNKWLHSDQLTSWVCRKKLIHKRTFFKQIFILTAVGTSNILLSSKEGMDQGPDLLSLSHFYFLCFSLILVQVLNLDI